MSVAAMGCDGTEEEANFPDVGLRDIEIIEPVTYLTPEHFPAKKDGDWKRRGRVLSFPDLAAGETVTVIAVHGSQKDEHLEEPAANEVPFYIRMSANGLGEAPTGSSAQAITKGKDAHVESASEIGIWEQGMRVLNEKRSSRSRKEGAHPFGKCLGPYVVSKTDCDFWVRGQSAEMSTVTARLRLESEEALFFVDRADEAIPGEPSLHLTDPDLEEIARVLHERSIPKLKQYFGEVPDSDHNGKYIIVFSSMLKHAKINGYVAPWDQLPQSEDGYWASNEADIIYVNTPAGTQEWALNKQNYMTKVIHQTIAHETKHLISTGIRYASLAPQGSVDTVAEKYWIEEPSAVAAVELCGIGMPAYTHPKTFAEPALTRPEDVRIAYEHYPDTGDQIKAMYAFNALFLWRMAEKVGHDQFWKKLTQGELIGIKNLEGVMAPLGLSFVDMMLDFGLTILLDGTKPTEPELQGYSFEAPQINLRDGSWASLGIHGFPEETGAEIQSKESVRVLSYAYYQGQGADRDARVVVHVPSLTAQPYFIVLRH